MAASCSGNITEPNGNFNDGENEIILEKIMADWDILNAHGSASSNKKRNIWEKITRRVNKNGTHKRTATTCKIRWNQCIRSIEKNIDKKSPLNPLQRKVFHFFKDKNNGNKITWEDVVFKIQSQSDVRGKQRRKDSTRRSTGSMPTVSTNGPEFFRRSTGSTPTVSTLPPTQANVETALEKFILLKNSFEKEKKDVLSSVLKEMEELQDDLTKHTAKINSYSKELSKMIDELTNVTSDSDSDLSQCES